MILVNYARKWRLTILRIQYRRLSLLNLKGDITHNDI